MTPAVRLNRLRSALLRPDVTSTQLLGSMVVVIVTVGTLQPRGLSGRGLAVTILMILNCLFILARHLPEQVLRVRPGEPAFVMAIAGAAAVLALADGGMSTVFGFFAAGHAGYRLSRERAVRMAVLCSVCCGGVLLLHLGPGYQNVPWYVGAGTGLAASLGMVSRSRQDALDAARAAAASAERASQAEARELILAERGRIARDVHDLLAHSLAGINMQLEVADALLEQGQIAPARQAAQRAQSIARESLTEAQRTVRALREDTLPLRETLAAMADSDDRVGELQVRGEPRELNTRIAQALVRAAQEALINAHKHAPGAAVSMSLEYRADEVVLDVSNAKPTTADRPLAGRGGGMGLVGMRERAALLGGTVQAAPTRNGGWQVQVSTPISPTAKVAGQLPHAAPASAHDPSGRDLSTPDAR